jgi:tRNA pseudouridine38-40 synthase
VKGDGIIEFEVRGNAFLRHMVRIMIGTIVTLGLGGIGPADIKRIIEARDRAAAPMTAPAHGLFLMKVEY